MLEQLSAKRQEIADVGKNVEKRELRGISAAAAKLLQWCLTWCDPIDSSPPGSLSLGFSRQEHWSGLPFPFSWKWKGKVKLLSSVWLLATPWTVARNVNWCSHQGNSMEVTQKTKSRTTCDSTVLFLCIYLMETKSYVRDICTPVFLQHYL